jgi:hypothetical protein
MLPRRHLLLAVAAIAATLSGVAMPVSARAEDDPVFRIEFNDGQMTPSRLDVPANKRFKLELVNKGTTPAEFESVELRKEKVIAPGVTTSLVIKNLDPGEYKFFDDFHLNAPPALLVAK